MTSQICEAQPPLRLAHRLVYRHFPSFNLAEPIHLYIHYPLHSPAKFLSKRQCPGHVIGWSQTKIEFCVSQTEGWNCRQSNYVWCEWLCHHLQLVWPSQLCSPNSFFLLESLMASCVFGAAVLLSLHDVHRHWLSHYIRDVWFPYPVFKHLFSHRPLDSIRSIHAS